MRRAFYKHREIAQQGDTISHYLLLFYAMECGLKSVQVSRMPSHIQTTSNIHPDNQHGHSLMALAQELGLPSSVTGRNTQFRLKNDKSVSYGIERLHEAW